MARRLAIRGHRILVISTNYDIRYNKHKPIRIRYGIMNYIEVQHMIKLPRGSPIPTIKELKLLIRSELNNYDIIYLHYFPPLSFVFRLLYTTLLEPKSFKKVVAGVHYVPSNDLSDPISFLHKPLYINGLRSFYWIHVPLDF